MCCMLVQRHSFACVCLRHRATPSAPPLPAVPRPGPCVRGPEPQLRADRFGAVVRVVEQLGAEDRLLALRARGVRALGDLYPLCDTEESCMEVLSVSRSTFLRVADSVTQQVTPRASGVSVKLSSPPALARGDHPHFEPSQRGSLQKALEAISTSSGRDGVLQQADSLTTEASTKGNRDYLWKTWVTIATAWGCHRFHSRLRPFGVYWPRFGREDIVHLKNLLVKPGDVKCCIVRALWTIVRS